MYLSKPMIPKRWLHGTRNFWVSGLIIYVDLPFTDEEGKLIPGYNVLSFFKADSNYFDPSDKKVMLNLRVRDLFALLDQLKAEGVTIVGDPLDEEYGKFGWIMDPEGNKIELWEPPEK